MIRIFKLVLLLVVSQVAFGQAPSNYTNINGRYRWIAGMFDSTFHIPKGTSASLRTGGSTNAGALFYNTTDSSVYTYTGTQWIKLRGVVIDTTSLSNRINLKLNISDTASMLSPYARKNFLNAGTGISYSSTTGTIANTAPDQTVALSAGTGISISGTYPSFTITNSSPSSGGTVTSVGSNNGTGLTGGPITTSGTLAIDTLLVSTRAWRKKGIDSVQANLTAGLATKLNISDTASMLSPYARTNVVNAGLALKVNISDTASMLTPYLRKIDTTSMLSPYLRSNVAAATYVPQTRTITINGTSQDLTANRTYNVGTVTSVGATAGTGISVSGSPITSSGSFTITNTAPDQTVSLNNGTGISVSGTYPTFTITNTSPSSGGTVTSVGSGTGLSGGPITTSGTLSVDTLLMSTRAWRQKGVDSVQSNITNGLAGKVNISDTASMLTPYLRKIDTTAMLSPYLRANVAAATYVPQSRTITINGTSQDLSANRTFNVGTVTSVGITAGTGISVANSPVTSSGNITVTNTAPDQTVSLSAGTGISIAGTYPSFTITNSSPSSGGTVTSVGSGTGLTGGPITSSGTLAVDTLLISTRAWRQKGVDSVAALANTKVSSVSGTAPISSSGGTSPTISISQASGSTNGFLSSTDWTTFNNKQNALTNPVTGTGTTNYIPKFTSSSAIGNSNLINDASGNLGLGVTPSAWSGSYKTIQNFAAGLTSQAGSELYLTANAYFDAGWKYIYSNFASRYEQVNSAHVWYTAPSGTAGNAISFTQAMTLDASGRLGIGTTSPNYKLVVSKGGAEGIEFDAGTIIAGKNYIINYNRSTSAYTDFEIDANNILFSTGSSATERMRITSSGDVGIGTTSPGTTLTVKSTNDNGYALTRPSDATSLHWKLSTTETGGDAYTTRYNTFNNEMLFTTYASGGTGGNIIWRTGSSGAGTETERMRITSGGNVGIGTTNITTKLDIAADNNDASVGQLRIKGSTSAAKILNLGFNTTSNFGFIQPLVAGTGYSNLILNPEGGNVGIGTTSANAILHTLSSSANAGIIATTSNTSLYTEYRYNSTTVAGYIGNGNGIVTGGGAGNFGVRAETDLLFAAGGNAERMRITSGGQVTLSTGSNVSAIAQTGYSLTGSNAQSLIDLAGTWNTTGNPTAIKLNITNTASGASANLMDLQVGGTSQFQVTKGGAIQTAGGVPWKLTGSVVEIGGSNLTGITVEVDGVTYYLVTGYPPEPEPDPSAAPSGPSGNYKTYNKPTPTRSVQDAKIAALEKELTELKEMLKSIKK